MRWRRELIKELLPTLDLGLKSPGLVIWTPSCFYIFEECLGNGPAHKNDLGISSWRHRMKPQGSQQTERLESFGQQRVPSESTRPLRSTVATSQHPKHGISIAACVALEVVAAALAINSVVP